MQSYWSFTYNLPSIGQQKIELYKYSAKCIVLKTTALFGKAYSKHLKDNGGKYNMNLKLSDDEIPEPGWIFKLENQENLQQLLSKIQKGEVRGREIDEKSEKQENLQIFRKLKELVELMPDDGDDYILSESNGYRTYMTFGLDKETEDNCVYSVKSSKKKLDVYQLKL